MYFRTSVPSKVRKYFISYESTSVLPYCTVPSKVIVALATAYYAALPATSRIRASAFLVWKKCESSTDLYNVVQLHCCTEVLYFRTSGSTKVLSYFRTTYVTTYCKLRRYEGNSLRRYESTKVLSKVQRTNVLSKVINEVTVGPSCTRTLVQSEINYNYSSCTVQ